MLLVSNIFARTPMQPKPPRERWSDIQLQFKELQQQWGINKLPKPGQLSAGPRPSNERAKVLKDARTKLYKLLTQPELDVVEVQNAILDFQALNPHHWPQPSDYRDILAVMLGKKSAAQVSGNTK